MTDQQAAEGLRRHAPYHSDQRLVDACQRGADAIEMLAWLFTPGRIINLQRDWWQTDGEQTLRAYCEAQWRAGREA